ncbi:MAG TPA: GNAT family N-acetyltransferase [Clostridiales bacterium]|jgi:RimJ/RimL family protein N-acetyltransferase|nr:GNAT family N-acetyltransferase [Clostridiales bacterium]HBR08868.1 GNAT family N-acetyltransferase [Clostridiales bacterium]
MIYKSRAVPLKNGSACLLKSPGPEDAERILQYLRQTSGETHNMIRYEDEIAMTADEERDYLRNIENDPSACMVSAYIGAELAGNAGIHPIASLYKLRHRASFGMAVKEKYWHMGIGSALLTACIQAARTAGYEQLELEVVLDNTRAISLYERLGFIRCGRRPRAFKFRDGSYADELLMLLPLTDGA